MFVSAGDELEEYGRRLCFNGKIVDLDRDQQSVAPQAGEFIVHGSGA